MSAIEAVDAIIGHRLGIKWPNDLLAPDGRKVAGILAEADLAAPTPGRPDVDPAIVVGIGVNVNWPGEDSELPDHLVGAAASLRQLAGGPVDRTELLGAMLRALEPRVADLGTATGRERQAAAVAQACTTIGTAVRVELADARFEGTAIAVTPEGHLVVDVGDGTRTVVAGDVIHVRSRT